MRRFGMEPPDAPGAGHDVEIIQIIAMNGGARVVAIGYQRDIAVGDCHRLVKAAIVGIDPLEGEALRRIEPVVINLFQLRFMRQIVGVVFVRGIGRGAAARRDDFHDKQAVGRFVFGKDVGHMACVGAFTAGLA